MNAISKALDEIKFSINRELLDLVFIKRIKDWKNPILSLDECIMSTVIRPRVLVDCNLVGGLEIFVPLETVHYTRTNDYTCIYNIPKTLTQGRSIISALNVTYSDPTRVSSYGVNASQNNSAMLQLGAAVVDAAGQLPITSTALVQLIGENVVMVRDSLIMPANAYLRCVIENGSNLNHIQLKSYHAFAELVVHAVKAYIYNEYIVRLDIGELYAGQNLGRIKEIIESYADANEMYKTYLKESWTKVALMNDRESWTRHLRLIMGGTR